MPVEISNPERFIELSEKAEFCIVKRLGKIVKLKLRTRRALYTLKINKLKAEEMIKKLKCRIVEA